MSLDPREVALSAGVMLLAVVIVGFLLALATAIVEGGF